jgi:hypothetical protein
MAFGRSEYEFKKVRRMKDMRRLLKQGWEVAESSGSEGFWGHNYKAVMRRPKRRYRKSDVPPAEAPAVIMVPTAPTATTQSTPSDGTSAVNEAVPETANNDGGNDDGTTKAPWYKRRWVWIVAGIVVVAGMLDSCNDDQSTAQSGTEASPSPSVSVSASATPQATHRQPVAVEDTAIPTPSQTGTTTTETETPDASEDSETATDDSRSPEKLAIAQCSLDAYDEYARGNLSGFWGEDDQGTAEDSDGDGVYEVVVPGRLKDPAGNEYTDMSAHCNVVVSNGLAGRATDIQIW